MSTLVGVDVGASHTEAAIGPDPANPVARVRRAGIQVELEHAPRAAETISEVISAAVLESDEGAAIRSIVVGAAGMHTEDLRSKMENRIQRVFPAAAVFVTTDGAIALEGAFSERPGIVVCAGSGTIAYARDPLGNIRRVGGLGPILADEGSGFAIGRAGIRAAARAADGRSPATHLFDSIMARIDVTNLDELVNWAWSADRAAIAGLARVVCDQASSGDGVAQAIVGSAANDLCQLVISLAQHFDENSQIEVAFSGGILSLDSPVRTTLVTYLVEAISRLNVLDGSVDPVLGALSMADRLASR